MIDLLGDRSYYRCTNPRCSAKKQVEKSSEDPDTLIITYEGLHLHFAYPFFLISPPPHNAPSSPSKKPKRIDLPEAQDNAPQTQDIQGSPPSADHHESFPTMFTNFEEDPAATFTAGGRIGPQGLLEDMVPFMIRNPANNNNSNNNIASSTSSSSSYPSPPNSPSSPCSLSYSPSYFDMSKRTF